MKANKFLSLFVIIVSFITSVKVVFAQGTSGYQPRLSEMMRNVLIEDNMPFSRSVIFVCEERSCAQTYYAIPTDRERVTMNVVVVNNDSKNKTALLVIPGSDGSDGRVSIKNFFAPKYGAMQYLYDNADIFLKSGITLIATGCPTDQIEKFGQCYDDYRKSKKYADDFMKIIALLKEKYGYEKFFLFGHSSGGISSKWLPVNLPEVFAGTINSSAMSLPAGGLASSMSNFDMKSIKIPVLNIAHEDDQCPTTPYITVKRYSQNNLVTVKGGGTSGFVCGGANRHSFEGRQRGVSRAIAKWITTGEVQSIVDNDD